MKKTVPIIILQIALFFFVLTGTARSQMIIDSSGNAVLKQRDPDSIGHFQEVSGSSNAIYVSGSHAYLANGGDGLRIYDITDPTDPVSIGHIDDGGQATHYHSGIYNYCI